jgi:hypothetical protein
MACPLCGGTLTHIPKDEGMVSIPYAPGLYPLRDVRILCRWVAHAFAACNRCEWIGEN